MKDRMSGFDIHWAKGCKSYWFLQVFCSKMWCIKWNSLLSHFLHFTKNLQMVFCNPCCLILFALPWSTSETRKKNKIKRSSQKKERGYHFTLTRCSVFWLGLFLSWAFSLLPHSQFSHAHSTLRRKASPDRDSKRQGSGQLSQNAQASRWDVWCKQGKCSTLKNEEFLA